MAIIIRVVRLMARCFLFLWEFIGILYFLECPPMILGGFSWILQKSLQLVIVRWKQLYFKTMHINREIALPVHKSDIGWLNSNMAPRVCPWYHAVQLLLMPLFGEEWPNNRIPSSPLRIWSWPTKYHATQDSRDVETCVCSCKKRDSIRPLHE